MASKYVKKDGNSEKQSNFTWNPIPFKLNDTEKEAFEKRVQELIKEKEMDSHRIQLLMNGGTEPEVAELVQKLAEYKKETEATKLNFLKRERRRVQEDLDKEMVEVNAKSLKEPSKRAIMLYNLLQKFNKDLELMEKDKTD